MIKKSIKNEYIPDYVSPPGELLSELLECYDMTQKQLAERIGKVPKTINEIVKGKSSISPDMALHLEKVFDVKAATWNSLDKSYQEYLVEVKELKNFERSYGWLDVIPYKEMIKKGWIKDSNDKSNTIRLLLKFFGVASPIQWQVIYSKHVVAYRKSPVFKSDMGAVSAWLRQGEILAHDINCNTYNASDFKKALIKVRELSNENPNIFVKKLQDLCAECGIAVVFVPQLTGAKVSGATRWVSKDKAIIQLSLRYKSNDHLWFTFFHEAAHILKHKKNKLFLKEIDVINKIEDEADKFARDFLIPPSDYKFLVKNKPYSQTKTKEFARNIGIAPGIVVGRLQHDKLLPFTHLNSLKVRFKWSNQF